jgi:hypothetical protein
MPWLHLDLPGTCPIEIKRELATWFCKLYAGVMETQLWRPNVGITELGKDNLCQLGSGGLESITMEQLSLGLTPLKPDPRRQCSWFGPTSSSRRDRNSLRVGEVFASL